MPEEESVLGVLMYLYHHHIEKKQEVDLSDVALMDELRFAGFPVHNIGHALRWLQHLSEFSKQTVTPSKDSFRVFSEEECRMLDVECRGFILMLEQCGILTPTIREIIIHQAMSLHPEGIDVPLLKWVTLMVLFNTPNSEDALARMESFVLTDRFNTVH